jgi:hypothetical protein
MTSLTLKGKQIHKKGLKICLTRVVMKTMVSQTTYLKMMMKMERATGWNLENCSSTQKIRTTVLHYLTNHYLARAVLTPQTKIMKGPLKMLKATIQARRGLKEKKNGFLTL